MALITLHNKNIGPVTWEDAVSCSFNIDDQVDIWRVGVSVNLSHIDRMSQVLNPAETNRAARYLRDTDRNRFITSRSALRQILGSYLKQSPAAIEFKLGDNQKPYIDSPIRFNLSDSGDWILVAIAKTEIGIDVEYIKPGFTYEGIIDTHFNAREAEYIEAGDKHNRFFKLWTRKEAILKATGVGLTEHLRSITALDGIFSLDGELLSTHNNWELNTFILADNYPATIAAVPSTVGFNFYNYQL